MAETKILQSASASNESPIHKAIVEFKEKYAWDKSLMSSHSPACAEESSIKIKTYIDPISTFVKECS